jgi:chemotaxis protein MotB
MRRRHQESAPNHDRWLVSYADFVTLLFAFFVVMFASAQSDRSKTKAISEAVRDALEHGQLSGAVAAVLGHGKPPEPAKLPQTPPEQTAPKAADGWTQPRDLVESYSTLQRGLEQELKTGKVQLKLEPRGLVISLREAAFFGSGDDAVAAQGVPVIGRIAGVVRGNGNPLRLEGFTDSIPIHNSRFRSNWELSTARSIAMMELLSTRFQVARERMSVAGYAENAPVDDNGTEEGRAHNRRVDLVLLSQMGAAAEPPLRQSQPARR